MAESIVAYRAANGAFSKREDLKKVSRLGITRESIRKDAEMFRTLFKKKEK